MRYTNPRLLYFTDRHSRAASLRQLSFLLPRDAMHKRGLCRHAVSVCVCVPVCLCVRHVRGLCLHYKHYGLCQN